MKVFNVRLKVLNPLTPEMALISRLIQALF